MGIDRFVAESFSSSLRRPAQCRCHRHGKKRCFWLQEHYLAAVFGSRLPDEMFRLLRKMAADNAKLCGFEFNCRGDWQNKVTGLKAGADDYWQTLSY